MLGNLSILFGIKDCICMWRSCEFETHDDKSLFSRTITFLHWVGEYMDLFWYQTLHWVGEYMDLFWYQTLHGYVVSPMDSNPKAK